MISAVSAVQQLQTDLGTYIHLISDLLKKILFVSERLLLKTKLLLGSPLYDRH